MRFSVSLMMMGLGTWTSLRSRSFLRCSGSETATISSRYCWTLGYGNVALGTER